MKQLLVAVVFLITVWHCCVVQAQEIAPPLLTDANFSGSTWETETSRFLRLTVTEPGKLVSAYVQVPVAGVKAMQFSYKVRYAKVKRGRSRGSTRASCSISRMRTARRSRVVQRRPSTPARPMAGGKRPCALRCQPEP